MRSDSSPDDWLYNIQRGDELALELTDADGLEGSGYSPALSQRYLYGRAVDEILAVADAAGDVLWGLADQEGTIRDIVDSTGTVQELRQYDTFGQIVSPANPTADFPQAFTGRPFDTDTGLYNYRARWYDPGVGRFVSEDPSGFAGGDANLYRYAGNSPLVNVDPSGLCFTGIVDSARDTVKGLLENDLLMAAIEVGASFLPGVGEAMDLAVAFAPDSTPLESRIALVSFGLGILTLGMSPNVAPFLRATKGLGKMLNRADDVVDVARGLARTATHVDDVLDAGRGLARTATRADDVGRGVARAARRGADDVATGLARTTRTPRGTTADKVRRFLADESGSARIPVGQGPNTKAPLYEVDTAYKLRKNVAHGVATDTVVEHSPQTKWARDLIPGHSDVNAVGREPAIRVTVTEAEAITRAETFTRVPVSAREALAIKIRILRQHTNAPKSALQDLIRLNREMHPWDYLPLHRMELP